MMSVSSVKREIMVARCLCISCAYFKNKVSLQRKGNLAGVYPLGLLCGFTTADHFPVEEALGGSTEATYVCLTSAPSITATTDTFF